MIWPLITRFLEQEKSMPEIERYCLECAEQKGMLCNFIGRCQPGETSIIVCTGCGPIQIDHEGKRVPGSEEKVSS